jgi:acylaminoacyl-peptidase
MSLQSDINALVVSGFHVVAPNFRGSTRYGTWFMKLDIGDPGGLDMEDVASATEYARRSGLAEKVAICGYSYGGFMTNWIITHTDMFKAAVSQNGISSWEAMFGTTDIGFYFVPDQIKGSITRNRDRLTDKSPIYYAEKVTTPVLFIHSMNDYRCYIDQALGFHTVLRSLGKKTAIALFKEGSHTFGWIGKPRSRLKRYKLILEWFNRHLKAT